MANIMLIGSGGCGNKLLDAAINVLSATKQLHNTYDFLFINSNSDEMKKLKTYNKNISMEIVGNGTGKDRTKALKSIQEDEIKFKNYFNSFRGKFDMYEIYGSSDGGFGSGSIPTIASFIRALNQNAIINLRIAVPKKKTSNINIKNTIAFYKDILTLLNNKIINNVQFIDNSKMRVPSVFNRSVVKELIEAMEFYGDSIDTSDMLRTMSGKKYKMMLKLNTRVNEDYTIEDAIYEAMESSLFICSDITMCSHMLAKINEDSYSENDINDITLQDKEFDKIDYSDTTILLVTGCSMPNDYIEELQEELDDREKNKSNMTVDEDLKFKIDTRHDTDKTKVVDNSLQDSDNIDDILKGIFNSLS